MKKILYISNVPWDTNYGAGTSLRLHLNSLEKFFKKNQISINILCRYGLKEIFFNKKIISNNSSYFKIHKIVYALDDLKKIINFEVKENLYLQLKKKISSFVNVIAEVIFYIKLYNLFKINNFDIVHCNSLITIGFINRLKKIGLIKKSKIILHVREVALRTLPLKYKQNIKLVDEFICIDEFVKKSLCYSLKIKSINIHVLNNPFRVGYKKISKKIIKIFKKNKFYFAIIGLINEGKGTEFVIRSFLEAKIKNSEILIVGKGNGILSQKYKNKKNIRFLEEIPNLGETNFYNKIDYLIRGDATESYGRTTFEALLSGCKVIIPKNNYTLISKDLKPFQNLIQYYKIRSKQDLIRILQSLKKYKKQKKQSNNFKDYSKKIVEIYKNIF
jgi:hypothetical protein